MRPSLRFLAVAVVGWAGVRAAALDALPGKDWFHFAPDAAKAQPVVQTDFPAIEPVEPAAPVFAAAASGETGLPQPPALPAGGPGVRYVQGAVGVPVAMRPGVVTVYRLPAARPATPAAEQRAAYAAAYPPLPPRGYSQLPSLDEDPLLRLASLSPTSRPHVIVDQSLPAAPDPPIKIGIDRLQLSSWALLRSQQAGVVGSQSLASGGQLGASQAGARLIYNLNRQLAFAARVSSPVGKRGGELAAGIRVHPLVSIPVWVTAERRQMVGRYGGGRNDFALYAEGGVYEMPLPWRFSLDSYFQGGVVGIKTHDLFFDGAFTATRPLFRNISAGFGVWGGIQPGLSRVDAGPRITMRVRKNLKVHLDWRQKLAGNARPGSGPALTLAGDF